MRNFLVIAFFLLVANASFAQTNITVTNVTGLEFYGVHLSDANADDWGDDLLPNDLFPNETEVEITVPEGHNCMVDIMLTYKDDETEAEVYFYDIDVCKVSQLTFHPDGTYTLE